MVSRFAKHLGKGLDIDIDGEKYTILPLDTDSIPYFLKAMKAFSNIKNENDVSSAMEKLNDESIGALKILIERTLEISFPEEWKNNNSDVKQFGMKYMMVLLPKIMEVNTPDRKDIESVKKQQIIKRLQENNVKQST